MTMQVREPKSQEAFRKKLDNIEQKLLLIIDFYEELEILRQKRKHLIENLVQEKGKTKLQLQNSDLMEQVLSYDQSYLSKAKFTRGISFERRKSLINIYNELEISISHYKEVNKRIEEVQLLRSETISDKDPSESSELENMLSKLQAEKNEINDKIVQYVIKHVVEGTEDLMNFISYLEDENNELITKIFSFRIKIDHLKDTIKALLLENQLLKKGDKRLSDKFRKSILDSSSLEFSAEDKSPTAGEAGPYVTSDDTDYNSDRGSTIDSFALDAPLALWKTDEQSTIQQVQRIGKDLEAMEINQMKLNVVKGYVEKHGEKYIRYENPHLPSAYQEISTCHSLWEDFV